MGILTQRLLDIIMGLLNEDCNYREDGSFKYIPYNIDSFTKLLPSNKKLFLDVGCGIGDKMMIATEMGYEAHGIEVDEVLFRIADKYLHNVQHVDAFEFNDYDKFDVIYMYRLYKDEEKLKQLRDLIKSKKKETAIFIEV